jgi:hypothetical protein
VVVVFGDVQVAERIERHAGRGIKDRFSGGAGVAGKSRVLPVSGNGLDQTGLHVDPADFSAANIYLTDTFSLCTDARLFNLFGSMQMFRWLSINGSFNKSRDIYYDRVNPFQGRSKFAAFGFSFQLNQHIQQNVDYNSVYFDRLSDGQRIYTVHIINTQSTYQFDKHFRVRLLEQFDSSERRLLTDFLAMYELVPGTVFHAGYGSLYEKQTLQPGTLVPNNFDPHYMTVSRGLFFKASYLHRF